MKDILEKDVDDKYMALRSIAPARQSSFSIGCRHGLEIFVIIVDK